MTSSAKTVHIIGGGLAGSEAAWQLASAGVPVVLHEMRPVRGTEAHLTENLAELVCSNSFRSDDASNNAVGLLHEEMRRALADHARGRRPDLPAGGALAVDAATAFPPPSAGPCSPIRWSSSGASGHLP
jgi:methylenetetrahydrofolate--tRNA-(uracil-5-)-methyltransferase